MIIDGDFIGEQTAIISTILSGHQYVIDKIARPRYYNRDERGISPDRPLSLLDLYGVSDDEQIRRYLRSINYVFMTTNNLFYLVPGGDILREVGGESGEPPKGVITRVNFLMNIE